jgi:hypothetical protein
MKQNVYTFCHDGFLTEDEWKEGPVFLSGPVPSREREVVGETDRKTESQVVEL